MAVVMLTEDPILITIPTSGTWVDISLSDYVTLPSSGLTGVICLVGTDAGYEVGLRRNDSTDTYKGEMGAAGTFPRFQVWCGVDSDGKFEVYAESASHSYIRIVGYTTRGFTYFTNGTKFTINGSSTWTDLDCSSYIPATATGLIFWTRFKFTSDAAYHIGLRQSGSTDAGYGHTLGSSMSTIIMGCTAGVVQYYSANEDIDLVLMGYVDSDSGATFFSDKSAHNYSINSATFIDLTALPTGSIAGLFEVMDIDGRDLYGLRCNGKTYDHLGVHGYGSFAVACDSTYICEGKNATTNLKFYLTAYFIQPPTNNAKCCVSMGDCMII